MIGLISELLDKINVFIDENKIDENKIDEKKFPEKKLFILIPTSTFIFDKLRERFTGEETIEAVKEASLELFVIKSFQLEA